MNANGREYIESELVSGVILNFKHPKLQWKKVVLQEMKFAFIRVHWRLEKIVRNRE